MSWFIDDGTGVPYYTHYMRQMFLRDVRHTIGQVLHVLFATGNIQTIEATLDHYTHTACLHCDHGYKRKLCACGQTHRV